MLVGIKGLTGHGKTLVMTALVLMMRRLWRGCSVYANYDLRVAGKQDLEFLEDLENAHDGIVCVDEGGVIFDARSFSRWENNAATQWLVQTRHAGLMVFTTCQILSQLDKRFRECMDYLLQCRKVNNVITVSVVDMAEGKILCHWRLPNPSAIWPFYDTRSAPVKALKSRKQKRAPWTPRKPLSNEDYAQRWADKN